MFLVFESKGCEQGKGTGGGRRKREGKREKERESRKESERERREKEKEWKRERARERNRHRRQVVEAVGVLEDCPCLFVHFHGLCQSLLLAEHVGNVVVHGGQDGVELRPFSR